MKYWKQFAEMLGLELEQEFLLTNVYGKIGDFYTYKITENGIFYKSKISEDWRRDKQMIVEELLNGCIKAVPKPWKHKKGEPYWYYRILRKEASCITWCFDNIDLCRWKTGNCFKTRDEAEDKGKEIMEQIQKEYEEN